MWVGDFAASGFARCGIRLRTMLIAVGVCAMLCGLGVQVYRAWSPVRRWIRESRPGHSQLTRVQAVLNLTYGVPQGELAAALPALLDAAKDPDPMIRARAAQALGGRRDQFGKVFPILQGLMHDPDARVRETAIFTLERFVPRDSPEEAALVPDLVAALDDPKPAVGLEACRALYVYGRLQAESRRVGPAMARLVREEKGTYRVAALGYLTMIRGVPKELEPTLRGLLDVSDVNERIMARQALIQLGMPDQDRDAIIRAMLASPSTTERLAAAQSLIHLGKTERAISALQDVAAQGDRGTRERALEQLLAMLSRPGSAERLAAAEALIQLGDPAAAIPALKEMAGGGDKGTRDRAARLLAPYLVGDEGP